MALAGGAPRIATALALGVLVAAVYWPARQHEWLNYDDDVYVTARPEISLGLSREGMVWAFSTFQASNWFPLTRLSWMLDYELHSTYGPTADTGGLMQNEAPVIYPYASIENLFSEEGGDRKKKPLPGHGDKPPTERLEA